METIDKTLREHIIGSLEDCKRAIQVRMDAEGINASGRTSSSFAVVEDGNNIRLVILRGDVAPLPTLEVGREGGKVPKGFYEIILQWSRDKGIQFGKESERRTFAYFVSRKIAREGTIRNKQNVDVYSTIVSDAVRHIRQHTLADVTQYIRNELIKQ